MSSICFCIFCSSVWRGANCACNSADACLPSAVPAMAPCTLSTPTLTDPAEFAAGACAKTAAAPPRNVATRAAERSILDFTVGLLVIDDCLSQPPGQNDRQLCF